MYKIIKKKSKFIQRLDTFVHLYIKWIFIRLMKNR